MCWVQVLLLGEVTELTTNSLEVSIAGLDSDLLIGTESYLKPHFVTHGRSFQRPCHDQRNCIHNPNSKLNPPTNHSSHTQRSHYTFLFLHLQTMTTFSAQTSLALAGAVLAAMLCALPAFAFGAT